MKVIEKKAFNTCGEGLAYMNALAEKIKAEGTTGKLSLDIQNLSNLGSEPVIFTLKQRNTRSKKNVLQETEKTNT